MTADVAPLTNRSAIYELYRGGLVLRVPHWRTIPWWPSTAGSPLENYTVVA